MTLTPKETMMTIDTDTTTEGYWAADESGYDEHYPDVETGAEAAREYVETGDYQSDETNETRWIHIQTWRVDADGERIEEESHSIAIEPDEPDCDDHAEHLWVRPHAIVGGLRENPGVQGHGGGVCGVDICARCGLRRHWDTWAHDPETGEQGLESTRYERGEAADQASVDDWEDAETCTHDGETVDLQVGRCDTWGVWWVREGDWYWDIDSEDRQLLGPHETQAQAESAARSLGLRLED